MGVKVDINDIIDANSHTSAMTLTQKWADTFKKYALNENEELSDDPGSSFNIFLHLTAQGAAKMMYEQAARINEITEDTAILPKSLLNKLNSEELAGIYGTPASTTIAFCIKEQDIIDNSVPITEKFDALTTRNLVINKDLSVTFESHPSFILPYNVVITCKPIKESYIENGETKYKITYNIYGNYDLPDSNNDGMRSIFGINSPNISSRKMRYENETYIAFFLKMYQMSRKEETFYVSNNMTADVSFQFNDSLVGFELFRQKVGTSNWVLMGPGTPEGNDITSENGYNYSYDYKRSSQNLNLIFSKLGDKTSLNVGDNVKCVIYSTKGTEGNIEFPYMINNLNNMIITYAQDMSITNQSKMVDIVCLAFARDSSSSGGKDQLDIETIRQNLIAKKYSRQILITNNEIINKCKEKGLDAYKARGDIISIYYRAVDKLEYKNMILSTGTNDFEFDIADMTPLLEGYNIYLIRPTDVFEYDQDNKKFKYRPAINNKDPSKNLDSYLQYVDKYNESSNINNILQACFPFFIQYRNTSNPLVTVYDMNIDQSEFLEFTSYDESVTLDKCDISFMNIYRNPYKGFENGSFDKEAADTYYVSFVVYTGENTLNKIYQQCHDPDGNNCVNSQILEEYNKQYLKLNVKMFGVGSENTYQIDPTSVMITNIDTMLDDKYIKYQLTFTTSNYINDNKQIYLRGVKNTSSVSNDYSSLVPVDTTVKFIIEGSFTNSEINPYNKSSIVYQSESIKLVDFINSAFGLEFDIKTKSLEYYKYESDIPYRYKSLVYKKNPNYDSSIEDQENPNYYQYLCKKDENGVPLFNIIEVDGKTVSVPIFEIAHQIGDIKYYYTNLETGVEYDEDDLTDEQKLDTDLFKASVKYIHKAGDYKWYKKDPISGADILVDDVTDEYATAKTDLYMLQKPTEYVGVVRNVPWTDRLYFSGESMYTVIRSMYKDIIDRINVIKDTLFDGGEIYAGLKRTSGQSNKYKAYILSSGANQFIKNIALRISYRVKFKNNDTIDYKKQNIVDYTVKYINSIGDDCFSIDGLFEYIKTQVPDIEYINITKINDYENGSVQTILNDISVTNEILTVSQKVIVSDNGEISFEPNITVDVINIES